MTWPMASFAVLIIALTAGFTWYERAHPSAKVLALVATLAALAALGRIAFAPLPSVKPTTDIVLLSGYVLGGAPGFAVGAIAALTSNFFFGQGPYTPWQMVGWGAVGVFGAVIARLVGRDLGRVPLAVACGAAGLGYGLFMDFHLWVTYTSHSLGEMSLLATRSVPFNAAHVIGNVVFCLAFGPVLVRALTRFRDRFEITWRPLPVAAAIAAALVLVAGSAALPQQAQASTASRAVAYLKAAQTADGGFADRRGGRTANEMTSGWVAIGLAAAGTRPSSATGAYLTRKAARVRDVGDMERTILALRAAGRDPKPLAARLARRRRADGSYERLVNRTAFALLAHKAAGRRTDAKTVAWLVSEQNDDGGWSVGGKGGESGVDDTAGVVIALGAVGRRSSPAVRRAATWLTRRQGPDGGFPLSPGDPSNAQSTAFVTQALIAAGRSPSRVRNDGSRSPQAYLRSLQNADGSIRYSRTSRQTPTWVTAQALAAIAGRTLPVRAPARRARTAAAAPRAAQKADPAAQPEADAEDTPRRKARAAEPEPEADPRILRAQARRIGATTALLLGPFVV